jgi:hypothetical protein
MVPTPLDPGNGPDPDTYRKKQEDIFLNWHSRGAEIGSKEYEQDALRREAQILALAGRRRG